jgi:futalosine hydrolase
MEGAAVFKVCNEFFIPCIQIRAISNKVEKRNKENWNMPLAIRNLNNQVAKIIMKL